MPQAQRAKILRNKAAALIAFRVAAQYRGQVCRLVSAGQAWLGELYAGYGTIPPWSIRHEAMIESCARRAETAARGSRQQTIERWHHHLEATMSMEALVG